MEEILPRLYRIVVPLPGNPLKEINSYVLPISPFMIAVILV